MPIADQLDSPKFRQARAEQARVLAVSFEDRLTRDMMLPVADGMSDLQNTRKMAWAQVFRNELRFVFA